MKTLMATWRLMPPFSLRSHPSGAMWLTPATTPLSTLTPPVLCCLDHWHPHVNQWVKCLAPGLHMLKPSSHHSAMLRPTCLIACYPATHPTHCACPAPPAPPAPPTSCGPTPTMTRRARASNAIAARGSDTSGRIALTNAKHRFTSVSNHYLCLIPLSSPLDYAYYYTWTTLGRSIAPFLYANHSNSGIVCLDWFLSLSAVFLITLTFILMAFCLLSIFLYFT